MRHILLLAIIPALLGASGLAMAQSSEVRTDEGPKGSNFTPEPGRPPGSTPGGATPTNPGGLAKNPHDCAGRAIHGGWAAARTGR